jgi:malate synthase
MKTPNQIDRKREDVRVTGKDLITFPDATGNISEAGLRTNISVGIQYVEAWLRGQGAVPIFNLMEDAATAEISRSQVWQWIRHPKGVLSDGRKVTVELFRTLLAEEMDKIKGMVGEKQFAAGKYQLARDLMDQITTSEEFADFLTLPGYRYLD